MALFTLFLLACAVRLPGIFSAPFWSDEYFSWLTAKEPSFLQFFLRCTGADVYPPLSYFPIWILAKFSDAAWVLRLSSAFAGVFCSLLAFRLLRRYLKPSWAFCLAALLALAPLSVYLGWEAKAYNVFALFNLLMLDEALRLLEAPLRSKRWMILCCTGSLWSFYLSPYFMLAILLGAYWIEGTFSAAWMRLGRAMAWALLCALPLAPFFLKTLLLFQGSSAFNTALPLAPLFSFENFSVGFWLSPLEQALGFCLFGLAVLALFWTGSKSKYSEHPQQASLGSLKKMLLALAFLPPLLFLMVSALAKPNYNDRAMLISGFAWILLAGLGALSLPRKLGIALLAGLLGAQSFALFQYQKNEGVQRVDYAKAWGEVASAWQEGDIVMHAYFESGLPFKYYAEREFEQGLRQEPRPNFVHEHEMGFSSDAKAQGIRGAWRKLNAWLTERQLGVYMGLDPIFVDGASLDAATAHAKRIWYVVASDEAVRRQMISIPNAFRGGQAVGRSFSFAAETWMSGKWKFKSETGDDNVKVYLFVPQS